MKTLLAHWTLKKNTPRVRIIQIVTDSTGITRFLQNLEKVIFRLLVHNCIYIRVYNSPLVLVLRVGNFLCVLVLRL